MRTATRFGLLAILAALLVPRADAQFGRAAGDDFIFFSDGLNFRLELEGSRSYFRTVEDPVGEEGTVAEYDFFNNVRTLGFRFSGGREGISFLENVIERDTLFFKFRAQPVHAGQGADNFTLRFEDRYGSLGTVAEGNNVPFRLDWTFPDSLLDGTWHDLAIPLPPRTFNELQALKDGANPDPFTANWRYSGSSGGVDGAVDAGGPIGTDGLGPNTAQRPAFWREFEWEYVINVGTHWPVDPSGDGSATVWFDDFYIGGSDVDLAAARSAPAPYSAPLTPSTKDNVLTLDLVQSPSVAAYRAFFSGSPITGFPSTAADTLNVLATPLIEPRLFPVFDPTDAEDVAARYVATRPHPNVGAETVDVYYGVSTFNVFGEETTTLATGGPTTVTRAVRPWIYEVSSKAADTVIGELAAGRVDPAALMTGDRRPFQMGVGRGLASDFGDPAQPGDASANVWVAFAEDSEDADNTLFVVYAEVQDDVLIAGQDADQDNRADGSSPEKYDSVFMRFGGYDIEDGVASGGNATTEVGTARPDYVVYFQLLRDNPDDATQRKVTGIDMVSGSDPIGSIVTPAVEVTQTGYRFMAVFGADEIRREGEPLFDRPDSDEIRVIPLSLNLQDQDFGNVFSTANRTLYYDTNRGDFDGPFGRFFSAPIQWPAAAVVGMNVTAVDGEDGPAPTSAFRLGQSYPNPVASGSATVEFELDQAGPVSLTVYNVLGQEVVRVLDGAEQRAGVQSVRVDVSGLAAGVYFYRLNAGERSATRRMVVVR